MNRRPLSSRNTVGLDTKDNKKTAPITQRKVEDATKLRRHTKKTDVSVERSENTYRVRQRMAEAHARREAQDGAKKQNSLSNKKAVRATAPERGNAGRPWTSINEFYKEAGQRESPPGGIAKGKLRRVFVGVVSTALIVAFAVGAVAVVYKSVFRISDVTLVGTENYTAEDIMRAAGVSMGDTLYTFSAQEVFEKVRFAYPGVQALSVNRKVPGTVTFTVREEEAAFSCVLYGERWALSPTLRLLYPVDEDRARVDALTSLKLPPVKSAIAGQTLVFTEESAGESVQKIVDLLIASGIKDRITAVDLRSPYALQMVCDHRFLLEFGDCSSVETKLRVAEAVLKDKLFENEMRAKIDLTTAGETSVVLDDQIELFS